MNHFDLSSKKKIVSLLLFSVTKNRKTKHNNSLFADVRKKKRAKTNKINRILVKTKRKEINDTKQTIS